MNKSFGYLEESKRYISMICPKCGNVEVVSKESFSDVYTGVLRESKKCSCGFDSPSINRESLQAIVNQNSRKSTIILCLSFLSCLSAMILNQTLLDKYYKTIVIILVFSLSLCLFYIGMVIRKKNNHIINQGKDILITYIEEEKSEDLNNVKGIINERLKSLNMPDNPLCVTITKKSNSIFTGKSYIWISDNKIYFYPYFRNNMDYEKYVDCVDSVNEISIDLDKIEYFATQGEIFRENKITGGGGGGSSISGAIAGGVIAGGAGAIIGSRQKIEPLSSQLITIDTRETYINYFDKYKQRQSIFLEFIDYQTLIDLIPTKEYSIVTELKKNKLIQSVQKDDNIESITVTIRELAKLKDDGLLSEDEFLSKKKELLERI